MSRNYFTPEEDAVVRADHEAGKTAQETGDTLSRTAKAVAARRVKLGLKKAHHNTALKWTPAMDDVIRRNLHVESRQRIADMLGVTKSAVQGRVKRLGLARETDLKPWTDEEDAYLRENVNRLSQAEMAREMKRDYGTVVRRLKKLKIKRDHSLPPVYITPRAKKVVEETIPLTARPWLTRDGSRECKYLYGQRHAYLACCAPVWMETGMCEAHAALCGGYRKVAA